MIRRYITLIIIPFLLIGCNKNEQLTGIREEIKGITYNGMEVKPSKNVFISTTFSPQLNGSLKVLWKRALGKMPIISNIIIDNNNLYTIDSNGNLYCINKNTGAIVYKQFITKPPQFNAMYGSISVNNGIIYIGTNTSEVIAFNTSNKKILWNTKFDNAINGTPICLNDKIIVNTINNITYALNKNNGKIIWKHSSDEESIKLLSASFPVLYDNSIILTYSSGEVVSLDINTGNVNWSRLLIPNYVYNSGSELLQPVTSPVIIGDKVLVSNVNSLMVLLDAKLGNKIWEKKIGTATNTVIINNKWLFIISNNNVLCININNGNIQWKLDLKEMFQTDKDYKNCIWYGPLLVNNQLWIFGSNADILKLDLSNGKLIEKQYVHHVMHTDTPIIYNNTLYTQVRGNIYALQ